MSHDHHDYRGYAGEVAGGAFRAGDEVTVLPSGFTTTVTAVESAGQEVDEVVPPMAAVVRLADEIDVSRGDMITKAGNAPTVAQDIEAMVCWFAERPGTERGRLLIKHTTQTARVVLTEIHYHLDVNTLHRHQSHTPLALNDIAKITLRAARPLFFDPYRRNRRTGSFILIDETTNQTVAAGMILGPAE